MNNCTKCGMEGGAWVTHICPPLPVSYPPMQIAARPPALCPVCQGKQTVSAGFYMDGGTSAAREKCRTCNGKGVV